MRLAISLAGLAAVAGLLLLGSCGLIGSARAAPPEADVQVMVLGSYHMGNPGQDVNNMTVDPVTTPARQAELEAVARALAQFRPTAIAVERVAADQSTLLDQRYPAFTPADLLKYSDERTQIGFRLAHRLGLNRVYAVDEQPEGDEPDYFPFDAVAAWAKANGRSAALDGCMGEIQSYLKTLEAAQKTEPVAATLARVNQADGRFGTDDAQASYYRCFLPMGAGRTLPGADLNGRWYTRNAKIFAKLMQVAKPGDHILVIYGSGHNYWLRHFASTTPGFRFVDPLPYLARAR